MMRLCIIAFTKAGLKLATKLGIDDIFIFYKYNEGHKAFKSLSDIMPICWQYDGIVFIGACGIAVRAIAPFIKSKCIDPAIVVCDERGNNVISLLSGHLAGANKLTYNLAKKIGANPVITTATDVNNITSIDVWAKENNMFITDMNMAKEISASLLRGDKVGFYSKEALLPPGFSYEGEYGVSIGYKEPQPFNNTLFLIPKRYVVGIGCKKGTLYNNIRSVLNKVLYQNNIDINLVMAIASIDIKKDEKGIIKLAKELNIPFITYTKEELNSVKGSFTASKFVYNTVGVDCVCERAVAINKANIIVKKYSEDGVTISIGEK